MYLVKGLPLLISINMQYQDIDVIEAAHRYTVGFGAKDLHAFL